MVFQTTPWPDRGRKHPPRGGGGVSASRGEVMDPAYSLRKRLGRERSKEQEQSNRDSRSNSSELSLFFSILIRRDEKKNSIRDQCSTSSLDF